MIFKKIYNVIQSIIGVIRIDLWQTKMYSEPYIGHVH